MVNLPVPWFNTEESEGSKDLPNIDTELVLGVNCVLSILLPVMELYKTTELLSLITP